MRVLNDKDYRLFEKLVSLSEQGMLRAMEQYLKTKYDNIISTKEYIIAVGDIPIALVAHMDTVFKVPVSDLYYDQKKGVLWSPEGLGADDRAGIFAIIKILQDGFRPTVILTTGEESGGVGACAIVERFPECPIPNLKYMIQLDRRGTNDCVFYDCYCPEFVDYVESFGFCERWGSFSDISFLMPEWQIVGVNLCVGYEDEHSYQEILNIGPLFDTIRKVKNMLSEVNIPDFVYDEIVTPAGSNWWKKTGSWFGQHCSKCKKVHSEYELFPVLGLDKKTKYYCPDCIVGNVEWCEWCGEPFEIGEPGQKICKDCEEEICTTSTKSETKSNQ
jgi:hypothetical protein